MTFMQPAPVGEDSFGTSIQYVVSPENGEIFRIYRAK